MSRHRAWFLSVLIGAVMLTPSPASAATHDVAEIGRTFDPKAVTVAVNDTVVWMNKSNENHAIVFDDGTELSPACTLGSLGCQAPGSTVSRRFTGPPGSYPYHCRLHPSMTGVVVVTAASSSSTASSSSSSSTTSTTARPTTTTVKVTSSTTSTTRVLATSSTLVKSTTTTSDTSNAVLPGAPPPLSGDDGSNAAGKSKSGSGNDKGTVALIVGLLLAVSGGGGYLLWRLRPGRT
jgi:plastocyanin